MPRFEEISDNEIGRIVAEIDGDGIGVINDFVNGEELRLLQDFAEETVSRGGGEYVFLTSRQMAATLLGELGQSAAFLKLMHRVYEHGSGRSAPKDQSLFQTLRCLKGQSGLQHALRFHYDSYYLTVLLPIIIPVQGEAGHLIMARRRRAVRSSYLYNLWDKILLDNAASQWFLRRGHRTRSARLREVRLVPGNLYFFWGYRTVHANAACDPGNIRATALFHFGDPHTRSRLRKFTGKAKERATTTPDGGLQGLRRGNARLKI